MVLAGQFCGQKRHFKRILGNGTSKPTLYIPGHVWHLTHRCHKREFLLRFSKDRNRWLEQLFETKKRYGISILDFIVTSNHIHLIVTLIRSFPKFYVLKHHEWLICTWRNAVRCMFWKIA